MQELSILYDDGQLVAINKKPGQLVSRDRQGTPSLIDLIRLDDGTPPAPADFIAPIHRLDRPVSGVVLFARAKEIFTAVTGLFEKRKVDKIYWAVVKASPPEAQGTLAHHLVIDHKKNKSFISSALPNALLDYRVVGTSEHHYFLAIRLNTGKQHQIRAQLAAIGCPVKGDVKYGSRRGNPDRSISLHARQIGFRHPVTGRLLTITAPPPDHILWELFAAAAAGKEGAPW